MKYVNSKFKVLFLILLIGLANVTYAQWGLIDDVLKAGKRSLKATDDAAKATDDLAKVANKTKIIDDFGYTKIDDFSRDFDDLRNAHPNENLVFVDDANSKYFYKYETNEFVVNDQFKIKISLDEKNTIEQCIKFANHKINPATIHTASILDPKSSAPIRRQLENCAKKNNKKHSFITTENIKETIKSAKGGTLLITSHFEDGWLFAKDINGKMIKDRAISKVEIISMADEYDVQVSFLGCETKNIGRGTGFKDPVTDQDVANSIVEIMGLKEPITRDYLYTKILEPMDGNNELIVSSMDLSKDAPHITLEIRSADKTSIASIIPKTQGLKGKEVAPTTDMSTSADLIMGFFVLAGIGLILYYKKIKK